MEIFVEQDGQRLGPFTMAQLGQSLAAADIAGSCRAWIEGAPFSSTVDQLLANAVTPPGMPLSPIVGLAPKVHRPRPEIRQFPPPPGVPPQRDAPRERSTKLRPPSGVGQITPGGPSAKFARSRRARVVQVQNPDTWESLRIAGAATPFLVALALLLPWISGAFLPDIVRLNGYRTFSELADLAPYRRIFVGCLVIGSLGVGWCSLKGALDGGDQMPGAAFVAALVAIASLFILTLALPAESRTITHLGGACATSAPLLLGTAFGILPGSDNTPTRNLIIWIVVACLGTAALIMFLAGVSMGF